MTSKGSSKISIHAHKNNQEAMLVRNRSTIAALSELMKDPAFVKHRKTLDEVAKAVTRSIEHDQKWSIKCQKLQMKLTESESQLKSAMNISEQDKQIIQVLKSELEKAKIVIEEMNSRNIKSSTGDCLDKLGIEESLKENRIENNQNGNKSEVNKNCYNLSEEIEQGKLQIFELEEELTNKEKLIEELTSALNSKSELLENVNEENAKIKMVLEESKSLINKKIHHNEDHSRKLTPSFSEEKAKRTINALKKKLQYINKKDQISLEKVKVLIKNNKTISRQLQISKNQNNLMKLELVEQTKMLDLLSCQCCKLEENDKKQGVTICKLQRIRDKYVHMIGKLEQDIHDMKKRSMFQKTH